MIGLILSFIMLSLQAHAARLPADFQYTREIEPVPARAAMRMIDRAFAHETFVKFKTAHAHKASRTWFDQIYASEDFKHVVFIKLGLRPANEAEFGRIFDHPDGTLVHLRVDGRWSVAVFFHGFPDPAVRRMIGDLKRSLHHIADNDPIRGLVLPEARAESCEDPRQGTRDLGAIASAVDKTQASSQQASCLGEMWQGTKDSVLRKVAGIGTTVEELFEHPSEAWHSAVNSVKNFAEFAANFTTEMQKAVQSLGEISKVMDAELFCAFVGELAPDVALMLAGGYGSAKVLLAVGTYARRLAMVRTFLGFVSKLRMVAGENKEVLREFLKKLIHGEISDGQIHALESFSQLGSPELAMGAAKCAF